MSVTQHLNIRLIIFALIIATVTCSLTFILINSYSQWGPITLFVVFTVLILFIVLANWLAKIITRDITSLEIALFNLKDQNFSISIAEPKLPEIKRMAHMLNQIFDQLRSERQSIYQKELMLDKVMQNSPMAILLANNRGIIVYGNLAARKLFNKGQAIEGKMLTALLTEQPNKLPDILSTAIAENKETLFHLETPTEKLTYHYSSGRFTLNTHYHHLHFFKDITREINRQEVATWKKVIRIISHELNNSLAPISSMAHSSQLLVETGQTQQLPNVLRRIEENVRSLHQFIQRYALFARLPLPQKTPINWDIWLQNIHNQYSFTLLSAIPDWQMTVDIPQFQQVVINLLKNAHESGSNSEDISLNIVQHQGQTIIEVSDRGQGMSSSVMESALVPFYSTKPLGSGLGLALCQEIIEAHDGKLSLHNRDQGGLSVRIILP